MKLGTHKFCAQIFTTGWNKFSNFPLPAVYCLVIWHVKGYDVLA